MANLSELVDATVAKQSTSQIKESDLINEVEENEVLEIFKTEESFAENGIVKIVKPDIKNDNILASLNIPEDHISKFMTDIKKYSMNDLKKHIQDSEFVKCITRWTWLEYQELLLKYNYSETTILLVDTWIHLFYNGFCKCDQENATFEIKLQNVNKNYMMFLRSLTLVSKSLTFSNNVNEFVALKRSGNIFDSFDKKRFKKNKNSSDNEEKKNEESVVDIIKELNLESIFNYLFNFGTKIAHTKFRDINNIKISVCQKSQIKGNKKSGESDSLKYGLQVYLENPFCARLCLEDGQNYSFWSVDSYSENKIKEYFYLAIVGENKKEIPLKIGRISLCSYKEPRFTDTFVNFSDDKFDTVKLQYASNGIVVFVSQLVFSYDMQNDSVNVKMYVSKLCKHSKNIACYGINCFNPKGERGYERYLDICNKINSD